MNGNRLIKNEKYREALEPLSLSLQNLAQEDSINLAIAHNSLGYAYQKLNEFDLAIRHFNKSIAINNQYSPPYENLGDYYIMKEQYKKGLSHYQKAISFNIGLDIELEYDQLPELNTLKLVREKYNVLSHLIQKAIAWRRYYNSSNDKNHLTKSLSTFQLADQLINEIRFQSFEEQSKLYWQQKGHSLYVNAVELCFILNKPDLAFYFMEKNKALLLLGDVTSKNFGQNDEIPSHLIDKEFEIKRTIHLLEDSYSRIDNSHADSIKKKIILTKNKLEIHLDSVYSLYPEYAKAKHRINIMPYDDFKHQYASGQNAVLHFIFSDSLGFGLFHSESKNVLFKLDDMSYFSDLLHQHLIDLRSPIFEKADYENFNSRSNKLFQTLFPQEISSLLINKNLTIIPDQNIQQLPFGTLVSNTNPSTYLISDSDINYQYSISYSNMNNAIPRDPKFDFIGIAPSNFKGQNLPDLPFSEDEIKNINDICKGELLTGSLATKNAFISSLNDYNIIHLSTHASSGDNQTPWIAFANEKIFMDELNGTKNQAELVILSACNTSIGEYKNGEGAMTLARSFFYAGSNSVVASLWSTNDKSSKEIMIEFYKQLKLGENKSSALRNAKLKYINSNNGSTLSPYYWASTIVIGNDEAIVPNFSLFSFSILEFALIGVFLLILIWLLFRKIRK